MLGLLSPNSAKADVG